MKRQVTSCAALAAVLAISTTRTPADTRATELLAQARAALGGEQQLSRVHGLSLDGTLQRAIGDRQVDGEVTIDLQLPDRMLRTDSISPMGDSALVVTAQGVSGDRLLRSSRVLNTPPGAMIRIPPPPAPGSDAETQALRGARADFARLTLALLLTAPAQMPLDFTYGGEAEAPDGKADVIDVKGPGTFAARLFLDKDGHKPLMLTYRGVAPRIFVQRAQGGPPDGRRDGPPEPGRGGRRDHDVDAAPAPDIVDITLFLDDYRPVDGVLLPHHITRSTDGQPTEELTFKTIRINPAFKAETFK